MQSKTSRTEGLWWGGQWDESDKYKHCRRLATLIGECLAGPEAGGGICIDVVK